MENWSKPNGFHQAEPDRSLPTATRVTVKVEAKGFHQAEPDRSLPTTSTKRRQKAEQ